MKMRFQYIFDKQRIWFEPESASRLFVIMIGSQLEEESNSVFLVLGETRENQEFPSLAGKLEKYRLQPRYFKWFTDIYALYLSFNLEQICDYRFRKFSFALISRPHSHFDKRFAAYVLDRLPSLDHREQFQRLLTKRCKSKFLTIKRKFSKGKCGDYRFFIPEESRRILAIHDYPTLRKALNRFEEGQRLAEEGRQLNVPSNGQMTFGLGSSWFEHHEIRDERAKPDKDDFGG